MRIIVLKTLYRLPTLILLIPGLLTTKLVTWITAYLNGWGRRFVYVRLKVAKGETFGPVISANGV